MSKSLRQNTSLILMSETNPRGKRWVFTWCNYPENWREILTKGNNPNLWSSDKIKYLVAEKEYAPTTGMAHIQGYFELNTKYYRNTLYNIYLPMLKMLNQYLMKLLNQ